MLRGLTARGRFPLFAKAQSSRLFDISKFKNSVAPGLASGDVPARSPEPLANLHSCEFAGDRRPKTPAQIHRTPPASPHHSQTAFLRLAAQKVTDWPLPDLAIRSPLKHLKSTFFKFANTGRLPDLAIRSPLKHVPPHLADVKGALIT